MIVSKIAQHKYIYALLLVQFLLSLNLYKLVLTLFYQSRGFGILEIGAILASYQVAVVVMEIPSGYLADHWKRKRIIQIGYILFTLFLILTMCSFTFYLTAFASVMQGVAMAFLSGNVDAFEYEIVKNENQGSYYVQYLSYEKLLTSFALGLSCISGAFMFSLNQVVVFEISILLSVIQFLIICSFPDLSSEKAKSEAELTEIEKRISIKNCFLGIIHTNTVRICLIMSMIIAFIGIPVDNYYAMILDGYGLDIRIIGILSFFQYLIGSVVGLFINSKSIVPAKLKTISLLLCFGFLIMWLFVFPNIYVNFVSYSVFLSIICVIQPLRKKNLSR